ncbi:MAG: PIN domain-containing protein [Gemmatimonadales bacterium]
MIYLDTSVALAQLLAEDRKPPAALWQASLVSSRLLEYEVWVRLHARGLAASHGEAARELLARVAFVELDRRVLARALEPFPTAVAALDALHLASAEFVRGHGQDVALASYDRQMIRAADALGLEIYPLRA